MVSPEYPNDFLEWLVYLLVGAIALAAAVAVIAVQLARRRRVEPTPPPVPAHVRAFEALDQLERERADLLGGGQVQDYYVRLTDVAKAYLQDRFGVDASDRTTEEIRRVLVRQGAKIHPLDPDELMRFLQDCDLVKFARFAPPEEESADALQYVRGVVERTLPRVVEPSPEGEATPKGRAA